MILPGTSYRVNQPFKINKIEIKDCFRISEWADPRKDNIEIEYKGEGYLLNKQFIVQHCSLETDFSNCVYFYSAFEPYGEFSNFSEYGIEISGEYYPTVEHYYQSQKFLDKIYQKRIQTCQSPKKASELGKNKTIPMVENWDEKKLDVMYNALTVKFNSYPDLKKLLLSTQNNLLIENSPYDNFWGIGRTGIGLNFLGTILMRVRSSLIKSVL